MDIFERTEDDFTAAEKEIYTDRAAARLTEKLKTLDGVMRFLDLQEYHQKQDLRSVQIIPFVFGEDLDVIEKLIENDMDELVRLVNQTFEKVAKISSKVEEVEEVEETPTAPETKTWMGKLFGKLRRRFYHD